MCAISVPSWTRKCFCFAICSAKPAEARWVGPILAKVAIFFSPLCIPKPKHANRIRLIKDKEKPFFKFEVCNELNCFDAS